MKEKLLIFKEEKIDLKTTISLILIIGLLSGVFGFIYEMLFYRIDLGYFVKRGSTFGPIIPIYFFGGIFITLFTYNLRKNPLLVLLINSVVTGILEYATGFFFYEFLGTRLWDYNTEIWNWGNINGYICFRSIAFFGISSLALIYLVVPMVLKLRNKINSDKAIQIVATASTIVFALDIILFKLIK